MREQILQPLYKLALISSIAMVMALWPAVRPAAQDVPASIPSAAQVYVATALASEGASGDIGGRIVVRIGSYTTSEDKASLIRAFQQDPKDGMALLRTMSNGYINIEGRPGRKIHAVFSRDLSEGREVILIGEHLASRLEKWRGVKVEDYPIAVLHLRLRADGTPISGQAFPAVKLKITPDGYLDVQSDETNKVTLFNVARR
jgi:hypothetical protein